MAIIEKPVVLFLIPDLGNGGAEKSILSISNSLSGHAKTMICTFDESYSSYETVSQIIHLGVPSGSTFLQKVHCWYRRRRELLRIKKDYSVNVCISFLEGANYLNILSKGESRSVISVRGSKKYDRLIKGLNGMIRKKVLIPLLYPRADIIISVSEELRLELIHYFHIPPALLKTIVNFYDIQNIVERSQIPLPSYILPIFSKKTIMLMGRLHPQKEYSQFLGIFSRLKKELNINLIIVGEGDLLETLITKCHDLGLKPTEIRSTEEHLETGDVYFLNFQDNPFPYLKHSSLFVNCSSWEGFPNSLVEAMICKIPVISTDCPTGPKEIFKVQNTSSVIKKALETPYGWIMPRIHYLNKETENRWVNTLSKILQLDPGLLEHKTNMAYERVQEFGRDRILHKWLDIISRR